MTNLKNLLKKIPTVIVYKGITDEIKVHRLTSRLFGKQGGEAKHMIYMLSFDNDV